MRLLLARQIVNELGRRDLPDTEFPAKADHFRVFLDPGVHEEIQKHAGRNLSVEIGGVLVGGWEKDAGGPFVAVRNVICSELAASGAGELTFTHDAWAEIHRVMDADYTDSSIVGWYHTHPDFGIFLSERDQFIHEHFFSDPGQIAYVVDPIRAQEGVFVWRGGKTALCQHYWVGDEIRTVPEKPEDRRARGQGKSANVPDTAPRRLDPMRSDWLLISLLGVLFFLIGYLLADRKSSWERARIVDGMVSHFATMKVLRPGLRQNLGIVALEMEKLRNDLAKIRPKQADGEATLTQAELDQWSQRLRQTRVALEQIEAIYCFNELESAALARLVDEEYAKLRGGLGQQPSPPGKPATPKQTKNESPTAKSPSKPAESPPGSAQPRSQPLAPQSTKVPAETPSEQPPAEPQAEESE